MPRTSPTASNPFAMLTDPQVVLQAIERSERLNLLTRRVCRPLDRPLIPKTDGQDEIDVDADTSAEITPDAL